MRKVWKTFLVTFILMLLFAITASAAQKVQIKGVNENRTYNYAAKVKLTAVGISPDSWSVKPSSRAAIDKKGTLTVYNTGDITVTAKKGKTLRTQKFHINVNYPKVIGIPKENTIYSYGAIFNLKLKDFPGSVSWTVSGDHKNSATITKNGKLQVFDGGYCTITAKTKLHKYTYSLYICVKDPYLQAKKDVLSGIGKTTTFSLKNCKNLSASKWSVKCSPSGCAVISSKGVLTAVKAGKATVYATVGTRKIQSDEIQIVSGMYGSSYSESEAKQLETYRIGETTAFLSKTIPASIRSQFLQKFKSIPVKNRSCVDELYFLDHNQFNTAIRREDGVFGYAVQTGLTVWQLSRMNVVYVAYINDYSRYGWSYSDSINNIDILFHEIGHANDNVKGFPSDSAEWRSIMQSEWGGYGKDASETFADAFMYYFQKKLGNKPRTRQYLAKYIDKAY